MWEARRTEARRVHTKELSVAGEASEPVKKFIDDPRVEPNKLETECRL